MEAVAASGLGEGQRRLNGPQTSGRTYENLSEARYRTLTERNVPIAVADGVELLADVHRPDADGPFPVLVAASPYPRQIQNVGAPMGFIEAGQTEFFVPRGYVHVIVNVRGTNGSGGQWTLFDETERQDLHAVIEWAAAQPWSSGDVGVIGISYFAMAQLAAAVTRPPHLRAIFPVAVSSNLYDLVYPGGVLNHRFIEGWITAVGIAATRSDELLRGPLVKGLREILARPRVHARLAHLNGESALATIQKFIRGSYPHEPWDQIWEDFTVTHPVRDTFWAQRDLTDLLERIRIPVYLGCDWDNVPVHLPSTFDTWARLQDIPEDVRPPVRMTVLAPGGLGWPWESLHIEALAWFDHWLKDHDTGILTGPPIRYRMPGAPQWHTADQWPPPESTLTAFHLTSNGALAIDPDRQALGTRRYLVHGQLMTRAKATHPPSLPACLQWSTTPLVEDLEIAGNIELELHAAITGTDTSWIIAWQDIDATGRAHLVTAGWLRASLRTVDARASRPGRPVLPCTRATTIPPGEIETYRIPLVPNARHVPRGHRLQLTVGTSDTAPDSAPAALGFTHLDIGEPSVNTVFDTSTLHLPLRTAN
ncbi:CocE/NonD family hydrolase [Kocuria sp. CPCC 205263]|uniref:CocE/NonD family hydrolase n=1 Tax=Kocuria sp. CPCC 205263 TaxID=3073555 RepID=UPI0034D72C53